MENKWATFPLSLITPLGGGRIDCNRIPPSLANLLPEAHLTELGLMLNVAPQDVLGLLMRLGRFFPSASHVEPEIISALCQYSSTPIGTL